MKSDLGDRLDETATAIIREIDRQPDGERGHHTAVGGGAVLVSGRTPGPAGAIVAAAVDDDACPGRVVRYAAEQARRLGVPLRLVHVWTGRAMAVPGTGRELMSDADLLLSTVLYDHLDPEQAVAAEREILHDPDVGRALIALSAEAGLLVVAARGTPDVTGEPLGHTVRRLVGRTACPLAVLAPG
ncbi:universal stress protein [Jidongwangia harbinensis]|uniref:universal stress protein n=1 Tax=Jidongwangia harbinensis TaxID=2878561 RepID=UPI001CD9A007|nr:universal stress protein [Jidongwangia harbinensis]MCA2218982.1 universal stress protein [Jidongwangia harbinensis]